MRSCLFECLVILCVLQEAKVLGHFFTRSSHPYSHYKDVSMFLSEFSDPQTGNYTQLHLDLERNQLLVGGRDALLVMNLKTGSKQVIPWKTKAPLFDKCLDQGRTKDHCYNHVKVIAPYQDKLFTCGTNSQSPLCTWRMMADLGEIIDTMDGINLVPFDAHDKTTAIFTDNGRYFSGGFIDYARRDPAIFSTDLAKRNARVIRSQKYDLTWLDDSQFAASFEIGEYIYFFFYEISSEYGCGRTHFPRVARICKKDNGGSVIVLEDRFVTFNKARLNCSQPGSFPFYYHHIDSVAWDPVDQIFYTIFSTSDNAVVGTAVCAFSLAEIEKVFDGSFRYKKNKNAEWEIKENKHHIQNCVVQNSSLMDIESNEMLKTLIVPGMMPTTVMKYEALLDSMYTQLMDGVVQPIATLPMFSLDKRFRVIAVDGITIGGKRKVITYIGAEDGVLWKLFQPKGSKTACVVEEIHIFPLKQTGTINNMIISEEKRLIFIGTNSKLVHFELDQCDRYISRHACIQAHDPYCGWSDQHDLCLPWQKSTGLKDWVQDLSQCPSYIGKWTEWSDWTVCQQTDADDNICQCRRRECDSDDINECQGDALEVRHCTVNKVGLWGSDEMEAWILEGVIHGGWSEWNNWTACQKGGYHTRTRLCTNPMPKHGGTSCSGTGLEYEQCKYEIYEEKKESVWTDWMRDMDSDEIGIRYKITCNVKAQTFKDIQINVVKNRTKVVPPLCRVPSLSMVWKNWGNWTLCQNGLQSRRRKCSAIQDAVHHDCQGGHEQKRTCDMGPADTSWTEWTPCQCLHGISVLSKKHLGIRHRVPKCKANCKSLHQSDCPIELIEYDSCSCSSLGGNTVSPSVAGYVSSSAADPASTSQGVASSSSSATPSVLKMTAPTVTATDNRITDNRIISTNHPKPSSSCISNSPSSSVVTDSGANINKPGDKNDDLSTFSAQTTEDGSVVSVSTVVGIGLSCAFVGIILTALALYLIIRYRKKTIFDISKAEQKSMRDDSYSSYSSPISAEKSHRRTQPKSSRIYSNGHKPEKRSKTRRPLSPPTEV